MHKISIIGAGNVGASVASYIAEKQLAREVVMLDIKQGIAEGKALDLWEAGPVLHSHTRLTGVTNDYAATAGSGLVVITSGIPRKPGMSRDDLIKINAGIVKEVTEQVVKHSPEAIIIVVSNPLDVMTYTAFLAGKVPSERVFGMAGTLDVARYKTFIADALKVSPADVSALLLGGHGDTMVPLIRYTTVGGIPVTELMDKETLAKIVDRAKNGGGEIVNLMGTSAWFAPGASVVQMIEAIVCDQKRILPVCALLKGEYGMSNIYVGVPVILGRNGIEKIIELQLNDEEKALLKTSADSVRKLMDIMDSMKLF